MVDHGFHNVSYKIGLSQRNPLEGAFRDGLLNVPLRWRNAGFERMNAKKQGQNTCPCKPKNFRLWIYMANTLLLDQGRNTFPFLGYVFITG
jgi:hypothetical protein